MLTAGFLIAFSTRVTAQKIKFSDKDLFSKCNQIRMQRVSQDASKREKPSQAPYGV